MRKIKEIGTALLHQTRVSDWWLFRISTLLGVAYASILLYELDPATALPILIRLLFSMIFIAAFAHVVNDIGDIEQDELAGKVNAAAQIRPWQRLLLSSSLLLLGFVVWYGAGLSGWILGLLGLIALLQPLYALPPFRIKERGWLGVIVDSLHTHAFPTLFIAVLFAGVANSLPWWPFTLAVSLWAFIVGLRGIIYHQLLDEQNDRASGIQTYVTMHGADQARNVVKRYVFPAEIIALVMLGAAVFLFAPLLVIFLLIYGGLFYLFYITKIWRVSWKDPVAINPDGYVPLMDFYRGWPVVGLAAALTISNWRFSPVLLVQIVFFYKEVTRQTIDFGRLLYRFITGRVLVALYYYLSYGYRVLRRIVRRSDVG